MSSRDGLYQEIMMIAIEGQRANQQRRAGMPGGEELTDPLRQVMDRPAWQMALNAAGQQAVIGAFQLKR
jgi:hypothetical protein